jgi:DNA polymerase-3 subunit gamma/tau
MGHIALYRKWRPQVWEDLVGQEHISKTLINAIATNRITHAYLFCGSRGTGKTTTARILAKSLNCEERINGSPCNKCASCIELTNGSALDVIEIDAASNRGINEIRSLIEQVRFASVTGKYKVYIIDEFHMLTTEAFNAILKTLEEPPPKVVFVLATTEAHKILPTIISRCQRFDFQRIPVSTLVKRLRYISEQEGIQISDDSLLSVARKANGGLRDAISLLDQISSFSAKQGEISDELVYQVLGMVSADFLTRLAEAIANGEPVKVMEILSELLRAGNDPVVIITETIAFFRHLLVVKSAPETAEYLEVPVGNMENLKKISNLFSIDDILNHLEFLNETMERVKKTQMAQLWLEVNFVQLCKKTRVQDNISESPDLSQLINRITELEKRLESINTGNFTAAPLSHPVNNMAPKSETITNINDYKAGAAANPERQGQTSAAQKPSNGIDLAAVWERILHETKKKSIPAAAILEKGTLADIDAKINTVTVKFENEGFIELLKKKHQGVEMALGVVFGAPYRLVMEKGTLVKEEKKNNNLSSLPNPSQTKTIFPQDYPQVVNNSPAAELPVTGQIYVNPSYQASPDIQIISDNSMSMVTASSNVSTLDREPISENIQTNLPENDFSENFYVRIDSTQPQFVKSEQAEIPSITETQVKDQSESYSAGLVTETANENFVPAGTRKSEKEIYFAEVADVFKGKIIKKIKQ